IAHRTRRQVKQWRSNGRPRKRLLRSTTRDVDPMAMRGRRLTPDAEPVLTRKGQEALRPRRGEIIFRRNLVPPRVLAGFAFAVRESRVEYFRAYSFCATQ